MTPPSLETAPSIRRFGLVLMTAVLVVGCGEERPVTAGATARDSAGIRIVEGSISDAVCIVDSVPSLNLGMIDGPTEYQFYRVFDAGTLSDGRIAVVNQGSDQIRVFEADGTFDHAFGARGGGPGEFNDVFQLWVGKGDTLIVADYRPWRFSFFTAAGEFVRSVTPEPLYPNSPRFVEPLADGTFLIASNEGGFPAAEGEWDQRSLHVIHHAADGATIDTLTSLPDGRGGLLSAELMLGGSPIFEPRSYVAASPSRVIWSRGVSHELEIFDLTAIAETEAAASGPRDWTRPSGLLRWSGRDLTIRDEDVAAYREAELARYADVEHPMMRRAGEIMASPDRTVADHFPAHASVEVGLTGDIWVRDYPRPAEDDPGWLVFDSEGAFECRVKLPFENSWDLYEIGADYVMGKITDELEVEHVQRLPLRRPVR